MKITWIALLAGGVLMHSFAFADVSYQETTQYTGGSMMGMLKMAGAFSSQAKQATSPVTSMVMIHVTACCAPTLIPRRLSTSTRR